MATPAATNEWRPAPIYYLEDPLDPESWKEFDGNRTYAIFPDGQQAPHSYLAETQRNGYHGITITGLPAGTYRVLAKPADAPYAPVIDLGTFTLQNI